jgi:ABC-type amino acid transport substrate-binding protein
MVTHRSVIVALVLLFCAAARSAEPLRVGLVGEPPFVVKGSPYSGVSVDLWEKIAAANAWTFRYAEFPGVEDGLRAVAAGQADILVGNVGITKDRLANVEFSQPFLHSGFQIMVSEARPHSVARLRENLIEVLGTQVFWYLAAVAVVFTVLVFVFERRHNPDFPKARMEGMAEAFYYVVTLALTGKSAYKGFSGVLGRLVMVGWIVLGIFTVAYFLRASPAR